jgi:cell division protein FtsL
MSYSASSIPVFSAVRQQPVAKRNIEVRRRYIGQVMMLIFIIIGAALIFVWTRIQVIQLGYEVSKLRKETTDLLEQKAKLEAEVAALRAPQRLEGYATSLFGMRLPLGDEIVIVDETEKPAETSSEAAPR